MSEFRGVAARAIDARHEARAWVRRSLGTAVVALVVLAAWTYLRFGSLTVGLGYLRGQRLFVENPTREFGHATTGENRTVSFTVTNLANMPISVVGARSSCTCAIMEGLPLLLNPGARRSLTVRINTRGKTGPVTANIPLYTNGPAGADIVLRVTGVINSAPRATELR